MHRFKIFHLSLAIGLAFNYLHSFSQPTLNYRRVITSLSAPVEIVSAPDSSNRLFIVQKVGSIKVYDSSYNFLDDFVTVSGITINGERGLLSMAFHPGYKTNGLFFVYYTTTQGDIEVSRYKVSNDPNKADTTSRTIIITIPHRVAANHNGGKLSFGADGYLYFATGDGGNGGDPPNNGQNGRVLLGKMLRIDINNTSPPFNYSIPSDNPFVNDTTIADEIWALGLRNPFRWSFDRRTYDMWIADVGQGAREEINFRKAGETKGINYGWRCYEGKIAYNPSGCKPADQYISPIFDYPHNLTTGGSSVTGGYVYRGSEYPSLNGYYIFADYISNNQWMISDSSNKWIVRQQSGTFPRNIVGFGEGEDGSLYACSITENAVYKMEAITGVESDLLNFNSIVRNNIAELNWSATEQNLLQYEVESSMDSISFERKGIVPAKNQSTGNTYSFTDNIQGIQKIFYRLRIVNNDGQWDYSKTITVINNSPGENFIYPSVITNKVMNFFIPGAFDYLQVFSMNGALVLKKDIRGMTGRIDVPVPNLAKGIYLVRISNSNINMMQRIFIN